MIQAEYMDENTLWQRANDAIDTIIRKDESIESGALLQPCIEGNMYSQFLSYFLQDLVK
jgi:hypothetical protein